MNNLSLITLILLSIVILWGCSFLDPNEELDYNKRSIIRSIIINKNKSIEWYHFSLITGYSSGFIEFKEGPRRNLIMKSNYISEIDLIGDSLKIKTWGSQHIFLDTGSVYGFKIKIDTNGRQPSF